MYKDFQHFPKMSNWIKTIVWILLILTLSLGTLLLYNQSVASYKGHKMIQDKLLSYFIVNKHGMSDMFIDDKDTLYGIDLMQSLKLSIAGNVKNPLGISRPPCWKEALPGMESNLTTNELEKSIHKLETLANHTKSETSKMMENFNHFYPYRKDVYFMYSCQLQKMISFLRRLLDRARRGSPWRLRCIPSVFLAGVTKAGTTDLFLALTSHPDISGGWIKEQHYFSRGRFYNNTGVYRNKQHRTFSQYLDTFDVAADIQHRSNTKDTFLVDASVATFYEDVNWSEIPGNANRNEPLYISAMAIKRLVPQAKVILMFRNPVHRVFSYYKFKNRAVLHSPEKYHNFVIAAVNDYTECFQTRGIRQCCYNSTLYYAHFKVNLVASMYSVFLKDWLKVFSRKDIIIVKSEDYYSNRANVTNRIVKSLGARPLTQQEISTINDAKVAQTTSKRLKPKPETERILDNFFKPFTRELQQIVPGSWWDDDHYSWDV